MLSPTPVSTQATRLEAWVRLNACPEVGPVRFHRLLRAFGSPEAVLKASAEEIAKKTEGISSKLAQKILASLPEKELAYEWRLIERGQVHLATFRDAEYPANLLPCENPAPLLYMKGSWKPEDRLAIAVVGTREPTEYGRRMTEIIVSGLVEKGVCVVSGLARGVDTLAHRLAIQAGGRTLAVLGSGLARIYPSENKELAEEIAAKHGVVLSQFSMNAKPDRFHFPMRNAVISGLALGVVVIEGEEDSGSLITAGTALEQGREVFAVPGPLDSSKSQGPLKLIQQGAKLVRKVDDIFEELEALRPLARKKEVKASATLTLKAQTQPASRATDLKGEEARLHQLLREHGPVHIDRLAEISGLSLGQLSANLTLLELKEAVRQLPGKVFEAF